MKTTRIDMVGQKFNRLLAIEYAGNDKGGKAMYKFLCDCGNTKVIDGYKVRNGLVKSCGCLVKEASKRRVLDLTGQKFGRLTVIEEAERNKSGQTRWVCICTCGTKIITETSRLRRGKTKSCGCFRNDFHRKRLTKHGLCYTRLNSIYRKMKERCLCKTNPRYKDYGGRGIKVCDEWLGENGFINFYNWSMENGYSDELTIDRINVNGNYEPGNCRWATHRQQANNTRKNHLLTFNGETHTIAEWSRIKNIPYATLLQRIVKLNWTTERALTEVKHGT